MPKLSCTIHSSLAQSESGTARTPYVGRRLEHHGRDSKDSPAGVLDPRTSTLNPQDPSRALGSGVSLPSASLSLSIETRLWLAMVQALKADGSSFRRNLALPAPSTNTRRPGLLGVGRVERHEEEFRELVDRALNAANSRLRCPC